VCSSDLAFDRDGHRAGYGKGFYDRFLTKVRPNCIKAGVSFFEPISRFQDIDPFDIAMDVCFTPDRCYNFAPFA
jgi:5-formyltetrahydrofolate cyclo-ligase